MSCLLISSENNNIIITENTIQVETENSSCVLPNNSCLIIQSELNLPLKTEQDIYIETENSICILVDTEIKVSEPNKDPYFIFTRKHGYKYKNEDIFKYTKETNA